jgi:hypothetical protein
LRPEKKKKDENELESISNDLDVKNKELKKKNIQTDIQVTTNEILITAEEKDLLDNYKSLINNERAHLNEIVIVLKGKLYHHTFNPRDGGEVHFEFNIFNGSVFQVEVGKKVSGELKLQGYNKFLHDIEPLESVIIDRNKYGKVLIKQRILPEVCDDINKKALDGFDLIFYFEKVKVDITEFNSNIPYVPKYLVLPKKLSYHIKLQLLEGKFAKYDITRLHDTNDS